MRDDISGQDPCPQGQYVATEAEAFASLREYLISEIESALAEMLVPMNTGLIARSKLQHLRDVLAAWPDVTILGKPLVVASG